MNRRRLCYLFLLVVGLPLFAEEGYASFYAGKFQGRLTANGEIFDTRRFTAAHKTLPFNTIVRVTHLETGAWTLVRINDRGPFVEGRVIDLSRVAAAAIGMVAAGVAPVSVEVIAPGDGATYHRSGYRLELRSIQVGAFTDVENLDRVRSLLDREGFTPVLEPVGESMTRVLISDIPQEEVGLVLARLDLLGYSDVFVRSGGR